MKREVRSMRSSYKMLWVLFLPLTIPFISPNSHASSPTHGARAAAMGTAFVAIADDPSAILHNPAGLTSLKGTHSYGGVTALSILSTYENPQGRSEKTLFQIFYAPHQFLCFDFGLKDMVFGIGLFSPFGIGGRKWDERGLTRYVSTESQIGTVALNPTVAFRVSPEFSLGVGVDYLYANVRSKRKIDQSALGAPDGRFKFKADGGGWGFNVGLLYAASQKVSLGLAYRSRVNVRAEGEIFLKDIAPSLQPIFGGHRFKTEAETIYHFPHTVNGGIAYRPTERWTLGFEVEWVDWPRFSESHLDLKREVPGAGFTDASVDLGWKPQWLIKFGVEHLLSEKWSLRGGYVYGRSPVPERTLSPDNPDSDQHNLAIGFGYKTGKFVIDLYYNIGIFVERKVTNLILSGKYETRIHSLGLSLGYQF